MFEATGSTFIRARLKCESHRSPRHRHPNVPRQASYFGQRDKARATPPMRPGQFGGLVVQVDYIIGWTVGTDDPSDVSDVMAQARNQDMDPVQRIRPLQQISTAQDILRDERHHHRVFDNVVRRIGQADAFQYEACRPLSPRREVPVRGVEKSSARNGPGPPVDSSAIMNMHGPPNRGLVTWRA